MSAVSTLTKHTAGSSTQCSKANGSRRHTDYMCIKKENKTVSICRWHDSEHRWSQRICKEIPRTSEFRKGHKIQDKLKNINCISIYIQ